MAEPRRQTAPERYTEAETGCPAPLMIAQWAVESSWGAKPAGKANYFGIKMAARSRHRLAVGRAGRDTSVRFSTCARSPVRAT
jgi:hypothetical protein